MNAARQPLPESSELLLVADAGMAGSALPRHRWSGDWRRLARSPAS
jgi:hypothetical protein